MTLRADLMRFEKKFDCMIFRMTKAEEKGVFPWPTLLILNPYSCSCKTWTWNSSCFHYAFLIPIKYINSREVGCAFSSGISNYIFHAYMFTGAQSTVRNPPKKNLFIWLFKLNITTHEHFNHCRNRLILTEIGA